MQYENDFAGLGDAAINGMIGELSSLDARNPRRRRFARRNRTKRAIVPTKNLTAKAEFEKRAGMLPKEIQKKLVAGDLQVIDFNIYSIKDIEGLIRDIELMAASDTKTTGTTNINARKLEADEWMLLTHIALLYGTNAIPSETDFGVPSAALLNGEFEMKVGSTIVVPNVSASVFDTTNRDDVNQGIFKLANPKWIPPQTEIIPELHLAAAGIVDANVKLVLFGAKTQKN